MFGHTKTHRTDGGFIYLDQGNKHYAIPRSVADRYVVSNKKLTKTRDTVSAKEVFSKLISKYTEAGVLLKGVRARENMTQIEFAKKIGVTQANLSSMERGRRSIGKNIAKRIAKKFDVDYRMFLE